MSDSSATVLVIDDEADVVDLVCYNLEKAGYRCLRAADGNKGEALARREKPDAIVLDVMLPGRDGFKVFQDLRQHALTKNIPVLILSARAETSDRIAGLKLGVDDYLTKPFSPKELVLRVAGLLKWRAAKDSELTISCDPFLLDRSDLRCYLEGVDVNLTATEFKILAQLMTQPNELVTREALKEEVWQISEKSASRALDTHLMRLREKLGPYATMVKNVRGEGYLFDVKAQPEDTPTSN